LILIVSVARKIGPTGMPYLFVIRTAICVAALMFVPIVQADEFEPVFIQEPEEPDSSVVALEGFQERRGDATRVGGIGFAMETDRRAPSGMALGLLAQQIRADKVRTPDGRRDNLESLYLYIRARKSYFGRWGPAVTVDLGVDLGDLVGDWLFNGERFDHTDTYVGVGLQQDIGRYLFMRLYVRRYAIRQYDSTTRLTVPGLAFGLLFRVE
jgi:hypothetical protein